MKIVLVNGCFDGIHVGHLIHLKQAAAMGDRLVVALTDDETVKKEKGIGRPAFNQQERSDFLRSLRYVDSVVIVSNVRQALQQVHPDIFAKGPDYSMDRIDDITMQCCALDGIEIKFTTGYKFSSTALLSQIFK